MAVPTLDVQLGPAPEARRRTRWRARRELLGGVLFAAIVLACLIGPLFADAPNTTNLAARLAAPSGAHWFGTDDIGRDIFARVLVGGRMDLLIGISGALVSAIVGCTLGVLLGAWGGRAGEVVMRSLDVIQAFPLLVFAFALLAFLSRSVLTIVLAVAFVNIPIFIRLTRTETLVVVQLPFVEAARCSGNPRWRLLLRHVLPNVMTSSLAQLTTTAGFAIILTGGLSFLGVGIQPPTAEWGSMVAEGAQYLESGQWWTAVFPGLAIVLTVMSIQLVGDRFQATETDRG